MGFVTQQEPYLALVDSAGRVLIVHNRNSRYFRGETIFQVWHAFQQYEQGFVSEAQ
jgi:hypothetical protein